MKTERQFGMDIIIIEETIDEDIFEPIEVDQEIIDEMIRRLNEGE